MTRAEKGLLIETAKELYKEGSLIRPRTLSGMLLPDTVVISGKLSYNDRSGIDTIVAENSGGYIYANGHWALAIETTHEDNLKDIQDWLYKD